jgi:stage V sporulation protein B
MELETNHHLWNKLLRKSFWQYAFFLFLAPAGYIIKLLLTNALSVEDVWLLYWIINILGLISMYNDLWLSDCLQYFIPHYETQKQKQRVFSLISFTFFFQFVTGIVIILALYFGAPWLAEHYFSTPTAVNLIHIFCRYFLFFNILQVTTNIFVAFQKPVYQNITEVVRTSVIIIAIVLFAWYDTVDIIAGAYARILGATGAMVTALFLFWRHFSWTYTWFHLDRNIKDIRDWFGYAMRAFVWANIWLLYGQVDQVLLLGIWGTLQAGYYTTYQTLSSIFVTLLTPFATLLFPIMTQLIAEKEIEKLYSFLRMIYTFFFATALFFVVICISFGPQIATVLFGERFFLSGQLIQMWAILQILIGINRISLMVYAARWSVRERVWLVAWGLLVNGIWVRTGYQFWWLYWALFGMWVGLLYVFIRSQRTMYSVWRFPLFFDFWFMCKNMFVGIGCIAFFSLVQEYIPFPLSRVSGWMYILARSAFAALLFAATNKIFLRRAYYLCKQSLHMSPNK